MAGQACVNHPKRMTRVSCSSCGNPICTACMRETPVGMKCPACARPKLHAGALGRPRHYAAATGAGLAVAVLIGALATLAHLGVFGIVLPIIAGVVVGRAVAWGAAGHRHGRFVAIAVATTVVGLVAGSVLAGASFKGAAGPAALLGLLLAALAAGFAAGQ
ncbi:MAG TPA: hypothetical protein VFW71_12970 [Actinomycetota bacterium]|nr:hypothetical protein [Actinomycetota bacterium]